MLTNFWLKFFLFVLKINIHKCGFKHSLFHDYFCKTTKKKFIENIGFFGVLQKIYLLIQFHR